MTIITNVETLIPDNEDIYTADIRNFLITVASLVSRSFMDINIVVEQ